MPKLTDTYRAHLRERAIDHYGYVTTADAEDIGIPAVELPKIHQRGGLDRVAYGVYRFPDVPRTPHDQFMEAVLRVGSDSVLTGDAVLALHDLALVNPRKIRVAAPRRVRRQLPPYIKVEAVDIPEDDRTVYEGIPATTVARAFLDCIDTVMPSRLLEAVKEAQRRGLVRNEQAQEIVAALQQSGKTA